MDVNQCVEVGFVHDCEGKGSSEMQTKTMKKRKVQNADFCDLFVLGHLRTQVEASIQTSRSRRAHLNAKHSKLITEHDIDSRAEDPKIRITPSLNIQMSALSIRPQGHLHRPPTVLID